MKSKSTLSLILATLLLATLMLAACTKDITTTPSNTSTAIQVYDQIDIEDWIKNSSTFKFDGISGSIKIPSIVSTVEGNQPVSTGEWEFTVEYKTSHPGHGDRTSQVLTQVITNHTAIIKIENGVIISAVCDDIWDMQADKNLSEENGNSPLITITQEESRQIAGDFVRNSPTFKFDGIEDTLNFVKADILRTSNERTPFGWQFTFEFQCQQSGYGDRTGQILAKVITPHKAVINVEQGKVTEAVMDQKWDMINQKMLDGSNSTPSQTPYLTINEDVSWQIGETVVAATITRPDDQSIHPAVVFVAGSGPTDRDWNSPLLSGTNGSARLLAEEFAKNGYVTIRYDKRIAGPNAQHNLPLMTGKISMEGHIEELAGAVEILLDRPDIDPDKIFVLGNSEGTIHALNYQQTREPKFAGLILSAMPGRSMTDLLHSQLEAQISALPNAQEIMARYDKLIDDCLAGKSFVADPELPESFNNLVEGFYAPINLPFTIEFLSLVPAPMLNDVTVPVLVITGKKDIQVDPLLDGIPLENAAKGQDNISFAYPENANHVLKYESRPCEELTGADAVVTYNAPDRILDPEALEIIYDWLKQNG